MTKTYIRADKELFHVHTYRCRHAGNEQDEAYVQRAMELGALRITFTDHAPFPGNPFGNRMQIEELKGYVSSLRQLKEKYKEKIDVYIGLEVEYLPAFHDYYLWLKDSGDFDVLMIGQHFYECEDGKHSFSLEQNVRNETEASGICNAVIQGIETGCFQVAAHPDRMFRYCDCWTKEMEAISLRLINAAIDNRITLEKNLAAMERKKQYWEEFWQLVPESLNTIVGVDAHSVSELGRSCI